MSGVRLGNETLDCIPATARIRPLRDVIIVEPYEYIPSTIVDVAYMGKPVRGKVLAVGPGCYPKRYDGPKGKRTKSWDSKAFRPCDVKVGDKVELGGIEIGGFLHRRIRWGDKDVVVCREEDVCMIVVDD